MLHCGALSASQPPRGSRHPWAGVPFTVVLGAIDDAHTALRAVVGKDQDVKEVLLCRVALQDLLVHILRHLRGEDETLLEGHDCDGFARVLLQLRLVVCAASVSYGKASILLRGRRSNHPAKAIARRAGHRIPHQGGGGRVGLMRSTGLDALQRGQEARTGISASRDES